MYRVRIGFLHPDLAAMELKPFLVAAGPCFYSVVLTKLIKRRDSAGCQSSGLMVGPLLLYDLS